MGSQTTNIHKYSVIDTKQKPHTLCSTYIEFTHTLQFITHTSAFSCAIGAFPLCLLSSLTFSSFLALLTYDLYIPYNFYIYQML